MKNIILKTATVILLLVTLTMANIVFVGSSLVSYAVGDVSTSHQNVEFDVYFKDSSGKKVSTLEQESGVLEQILYLQVSVKKEGYFNGDISFENTNFEIDSVDSVYENKTSRKKILLNQINAGTSTEIAVKVRPIKEEVFNVGSLTDFSKINISGTYKNSTQKDIKITGTKEVFLKLVENNTDDNILNEVKMVMNKLEMIDGEEKRVVQLSWDMGLKDNNYPIKEIKGKMLIPEFDGKKAEIVKNVNWNNMTFYDYSYNGKEVVFTLKNDAQDNYAVWKTEGNENIVLTCIYDKDVNTDEFNVTAEEVLNLYNGKELKNNFTGILELQNNVDKELLVDGSIVSNEESMYKGKLYADVERQFTTTTELKVNYASAVTKMNIEENHKYMIGEDGYNVETVYNRTVINKEEFNNMLGESGVLAIYNQNNERVAEVTDSSVVNEDGNVIIDYSGKDVKTIRVETTNPIKEGSLKIENTKTIVNSNKDVLKNASLLRTTSFIARISEEYTSEGFQLSSTSRVECNTDIYLNETKTEAKLELNKETLSTVISNNVEMKVVLKTNNEQYDLYKNPEIILELPSQVEKIDINSIDLVYEDELTIKDYVVDGRTIKIYLDGEQTKYKETAIEGTNIVINANIAVNRKAATSDESVRMLYRNENAKSYVEDGISNKPIRVVAPKDVTTIHSFKELGVETIGQEEARKILIQRGMEARQVEAQIEVINNNQESIENVRIMGEFPTNNEKNNLDIKLLEGINVENAKVYYTKNEKATDDIQKAENKWTQNFEDAKKYLIVSDEIAMQESLQATYKIEIPENLEYNQSAKAFYNVTYENTVSNVENKLDASVITLDTGIGPNVEAKLKAMVAGKETSEPVKNGEVIKYRLEVSNAGTEEAKNVSIEGQVPAGTKRVQPKPNFEYTGSSYYDELSDTKYEDKIETLKPGETVYKEYEVRVEKNTSNGTVLENKVKVNYGDVLKETNTVKNTVTKGELQVSVKRVTDRSTELYEKSSVRYFAIIENISGEKLDNVKVESNVPENFEVDRLRLFTGMESEDISDEDIRNDGQETTYVEGQEPEHVEDNIESKDLEYKKEVDIGTLEKDEIKVLCYDLVAKIANNKTEFSVIGKSSNINHNSNVLFDKILNTNIEMEMTAISDSNIIKAGDIIKYVITVNNKSDARTSGLDIKDVIPSQLTVTKVTADGQELDVSSLGNNLTISVDIAPKGSAVIEIETVVDYSEDRDNSEVITNEAYAEVLGEKIATTQKITHIIQSNSDTENDENGGNNGGNNGGSNNVDDNNIAKGTRTITGTAWFDENANGIKDNDEDTLNNVKAKLLNVETNKFVRNIDGEELEVTTNDNGVYILDKIGNGKYIVVFDYNTAEYTVTKYKVEGASESQNSDAMRNKLIIDGEEKSVTSTDIIEISNSNISDIDIGLIQLVNFDLKLDKYVSRILIQNASGSTVKEYNDEKMAKAEIDAKQISGSNVIIEYKIKVTNNGEVEGYAKKIADYIPNDLKFNSELNKDWYVSNGTLYNTSLANDKIAAGEEKVLTLTLTKLMTEENTGLINNTAEIAEDYNELGILDSNSTPGNRTQGENDMSSADIILSIRTGGVVYTTIAIIVGLALGFTVFIIVKNKNREEEI